MYVSIYHLALLLLHVRLIGLFCCSETVSGIPSVVRGKTPSEFNWLAGLPPKAKDGSASGPQTVFVMGDDGLSRLLILATEWKLNSQGRTTQTGSSLMHLILLEIGFPPLLIYDSIRDGYVYELVVFSDDGTSGGGSSNVFRANWEGVHDLIKACWKPVLSNIVEQHMLMLQSTSYADLQEEYDYSMFDAAQAGPDGPYWMSAEKLTELGDGARVCDVRAFVYCVMGLNRLFTGDGFTLREDGRQGMAEYIVMNQRRSTLIQQGTKLHHCSLGSATLKECFRYVCDEYTRMKEEYPPSVMARCGALPVPILVQLANMILWCH